MMENNNQNNTNIPGEIETYIDNFLSIYSLDANARVLSYEHIRKIFLEHRNDPSKRELITLHLYSYLASWGMLRNSFLLHKDYLFSKPVVDILCDDKYDALLNINWFEGLSNDNINLILDLSTNIKSYYLGKTYFDSKKNEYLEIKGVSDTLVSKIILGTFGCLIAYDNYAKSALSKLNIIQSINFKSINQLNNIIVSNYTCIRNILNKFDNTIYTPMKILDMYLFEKGYKIELDKKIN